MFYKKAVLKYFTKRTRKQLFRSLLSIKLQVLLKDDYDTGIFLFTLQNVSEQLFGKKTSRDYFWKKLIQVIEKDSRVKLKNSKDLVLIWSGIVLIWLVIWRNLNEHETFGGSPGCTSKMYLDNVRLIYIQSTFKFQGIMDFQSHKLFTKRRINLLVEFHCSFKRLLNFYREISWVPMPTPSQMFSFCMINITKVV